MPNFLFRAYTLTFRSQNCNFQLCQLRNVRSLTIRNRSSAIHVHLIEQTVDIKVRNGRVCTLENVTQLRLINSSITVHIKSLQKNQAHVWPRALSRNSQRQMEKHFPQGRITSQVYPRFLLTVNFHSIWLFSWIIQNFRLNCSHFGYSTIFGISGNFPRTFSYHLPPFRSN